MDNPSIPNQKLKVTYFQRKPRPGFSFSIESIFADLRSRLENKIEAEVKISGFYNDGILTKFYNIIEAALRQGNSVNHVTGEVHFLTLLMKKPTVVLTVHDCGMMLRKTGVSRKLVKWLYLTAPIGRSNFITAVSEQTKWEIVKYTKCSPDKIMVIPNAVSSVYQPSPKEFNPAKPNILQIGTADNKNLERLSLALNGINCKLTIIGELSQGQIDLLNSNLISYSNFVNLSGDEMFEKYKECDLLAFVSTFEGFGMPIIEANCVERVVLASGVSSIPEVAADAAHLVDPFDIENIREGAIRLINDPDYREKLIDNGRRNRLRFDADKIADDYYQIYEKVIGRN